MRYYSFKKTYTATVAIFFLIIFAHYLGFLKIPENKLRDLVEGSLKKIHSQNIQPDNSADLNNQIEILSAKNKIIQQENDDLHNQLNFKTKNNYTILTTSVVAKNLDTTQRVIVLDRGADDGVKIDQPVIYGDGNLIGKIIEVENNLSFARILSDNQSKVAATVLNNDHSLGVVEGGFGLSIKMSFIPRNENILVGDQIITSGSEINYPRGLIIGKVAAIENEAYQPFQEAIITPSVDYEKINIVGVIINNL